MIESHDYTKASQMQAFDATNIDQDAVLDHLMEHGYVVVENMLVGDDLEEIKGAIAQQFAKERENPFDPGDGPEGLQDVEIREYFRENYTISEAELDRLMRRIRHPRAENMDTPWPVGPSELNKCFLHVPTVFDYDDSPRIWNIPAKLKETPKFIEHPINYARTGPGGAG